MDMTSRRKTKDLKEKLELVKEHLGDKIDPEFLTKLLREDREKH